MAVISSSAEVTAYGQGFRGRFIYTFDDGRVINIGPFYSDVNDFSALLTKKETSAVTQIERADTDEAILLGLVVAHKQASRKEVIKRYLKRAFQEDDPLTMYQLLKPVAQIIIDMGLTNAQLANYLDSTVDRVQEFKARWQYLNSNSATILDYKTVKDGM